MIIFFCLGVHHLKQQSCNVGKDPICVLLTGVENPLGKLLFTRPGIRGCNRSDVYIVQILQMIRIVVVKSRLRFKTV